jgi:flagellar biosynthetic protein FliS
MTIENPKSHQDVAKAYQKTSHTDNMSGFQIIVALYEGMIRNIEQAKTAYKNNKLDEMSNLIVKTNKILIALQTHLDFEQGKDAADFLNNFYNSIFVSLTKILRKEDPVAEFDKILAYIQPVYRRWVEFAQAEKK